MSDSDSEPNIHDEEFKTRQDIDPRHVLIKSIDTMKHSYDKKMLYRNDDVSDRSTGNTALA